MLETLGRARLVAQAAEPGGLTQTRLADRLGVSQPAVFEWFAGNARPSAHFRTAIEALLGIPASAWLTDEERAVVVGAMRVSELKR